VSRAAGGVAFFTASFGQMENAQFVEVLADKKL
jgi:hypothetical protein